MNLQRMFLALGLALAIAGCSSVKLDDAAPVDTKTPTPTGQSGTSQGTQTAVAPVTTDTATANQGGPASVARIIYFDFDSYVIKPEFQSIVDGHARYLKQNPGRRINIEGHTDERGGREYNLALGQRRSEAVRSALRLLGVNDSQMEAVSFGKEKPADPGSSEEAWAKNRRVEIVYR